MYTASFGHIFEDVFACDESFKFSVAWIGHRQTPQMHMFEDVEHFLQLISALRQKGLLNNVGSHINHGVLILLANLPNFVIFAIKRVKVLIEKVPGELFDGFGDLGRVTQPRKLLQSLLATLHILWHLLGLKLFRFAQIASHCRPI